MKGQQQYEADWDVSVDNRRSDSLNRGISSAIISKQQQMPNYTLQVERQFDSIEVSNLQEQQLERQLIRIRNKMHTYQQKINRKIDKYFPQLRPQPFQKIQTAESMVQSLKNEIELRNRLIQFQLVEINDIIEKQKHLDSKERIQFAIPLEISDTKKKIEELEMFIHIAEIKQKKKSQDLVKVDKNNLHQFQRTALLRTNLEVAMLYQISLNEREAKIDDHIYDFDKKLMNLDKKLQELGQIVQQRQIPVSSNKNLLALKEKKTILTKCRDYENKKIMLVNANINKNITNLNREIQKMRQELKEKQQRHEAVIQQCQQLQQKNHHYLKHDDGLGKSLRRSISFNYAQTLLKMKKNNSVVQHPRQAKIQPVKQVVLEKPNFKIRKNLSTNHSSIDKYSSVKKDSTNSDEIILPTTHNLSKKSTQITSLVNPELKNSRKERRLDIFRKKSRKKSEAEDIIDQY